MLCAISKALSNQKPHQTLRMRIDWDERVLFGTRTIWKAMPQSRKPEHCVVSRFLFSLDSLIVDMS